MKRKYMLITFCMACLIGLTTGASFSSQKGDAQIKWYSFKEGVNLGKSQGKKIFVTFYADWCGYCKKMDQTTFNNPTVVDYINTNYVTVKVNSDQEKQLAKEYRVSGLPTHFFLEPSGTPITSLPGFLTPEQFLPILKYISTDSYKTIKFDDFMKNNP